ncbi:hypothetical protein [Flavisolibacter tropicus]|uniref:hypothetical protein n=1 Tax=Flavisolibacter tropicus TaxID=1492898 RepID=UPI0013140A25|nr:hypothetical protein [Flavisolibacter tropicus]
MKNRNIEHGRQEVKIYEAYYKPSFSVGRFLKSVFGALFFGRFAAAQSYAPNRKRMLK